jgi:4-carboxymuconolactone decarboxylase
MRNFDDIGYPGNCRLFIRTKIEGKQDISYKTGVLQLSLSVFIRINWQLREVPMADTNDLHARGLRRRKKMFGEADVEKRMAASGEFGAPLQNIINAYVYGDVWERSGLSDSVRSLVMLGITAASNRPAEFAVHAKGALANGCTRAQVQDVLLLVAMYCGIPAAIETNRIAAEIFGQDAP